MNAFRTHRDLPGGCLPSDCNGLRQSRNSKSVDLPTFGVAYCWEDGAGRQIGYSVCDGPDEESARKKFFRQHPWVKPL